MRKNRSEQEVAGTPLADAVTAPAPERLVDGVPVRTYRGASLAALAPQIRAELGDNAMILRQREGVTGGIAGFFAKRMVEIDVAVIGAQPAAAPVAQAAPSASRFDTTDGPSVGPQSLLGDAPELSAAALQPPVRHQSRANLPPVQPVGSLFASPEPAEPQPTQPFKAVDLDDPEAAPNLQPTVPFSAIADRHGLDDARAAAEHALTHPGENAPQDDGPSDYGMFAEGLGAPAVPPGVPLTKPSSVQPPAFSVGAPSAQDAANIEAQLAAGSAERAAYQRAGEPGVGLDPVGTQPLNHAPASEAQIGEPPAPPQPQTPIHAEVPAPARPIAEPHQPTEPFIPPTSPDHFDSPFDPGRGGALADPVAQTHDSFETRVRDAGLSGATSSDPVAQLGTLHGLLLRRGLPDQIASPVVDDTLLHRVPLQPGRPVAELLASELARRVPTAPLAGRAGQAVAFVGSSGAGKTRAIARLAAAYGAAARVPVACVTLQDSGSDGLLATALAPFGIAVHAAPDAPRALDRITALRRTCLVLVDTPGVSPGDTEAVDRLGSTLRLLELDQVALCLPVVLAAPIARRVLRAMGPLGPTLLVATHADEADLLGGVVAVAIDRRVPVAYVSAGAGRGGIVGADAHQIATELLEHGSAEVPVSARPPAARTPGRRAITPVDRTADPAPDAPRRRTDPAPVTAEPSSVAEASPDPGSATETNRQQGPSIDIAAGAAHLAVPWIMASPRRPGRRGGQ